MENMKQAIVARLDNLEEKLESLKTNFKGQDTRPEQAIVACAIAELTWVIGLFPR